MGVGWGWGVSKSRKCKYRGHALWSFPYYHTCYCQGRVGWGLPGNQQNPEYATGPISRTSSSTVKIGLLRWTLLCSDPNALLCISAVVQVRFFCLFFCGGGGRKLYEFLPNGVSWRGFPHTISINTCYNYRPYLGLPYWCWEDYIYWYRPPQASYDSGILGLIARGFLEKRGYVHTWTVLILTLTF